MRKSRERHRAVPSCDFAHSYPTTWSFSISSSPPQLHAVAHQLCGLCKCMFAISFTTSVLFASGCIGISIATINIVAACGTYTMACSTCRRTIVHSCWCARARSSRNVPCPIEMATGKLTLNFVEKIRQRRKNQITYNVLCDG